jgi:Asp-tRNA(Asn)/Glu-tRNA(Gln) amidotransferase B subunit
MSCYRIATDREYHNALRKALREHPEARDQIAQGRRAERFIVGSVVRASKGLLGPATTIVYLRHRKVGGML